MHVNTQHVKKELRKAVLGGSPSDTSAKKLKDKAAAKAKKITYPEGSEAQLRQARIERERKILATLPARFTPRIQLSKGASKLHRNQVRENLKIRRMSQQGMNICPWRMAQTGLNRSVTGWNQLVASTPKERLKAADEAFKGKSRRDRKEIKRALKAASMGPKPKT